MIQALSCSATIPFQRTSLDNEFAPVPNSLLYLPPRGAELFGYATIYVSFAPQEDATPQLSHGKVSICNIPPHPNSDPGQLHGTWEYVG
jgi:hypothetical protein